MHAMRFLKNRRTRTTAAALAVTAGLTFSLVACSSDDDSSTDTGSSSSSGDDQSETVSVDHLMGSTDVPVNLEKIVSFSPAFTDAFAALDRPVDVEYRAAGYDTDVPWTAEPAGDNETYDAAADGISAVTENIAAADPDVIFAGFLPDQETYDKLSEIAPTVAVVGDNPSTDDWRKATEIAGEVLDRSGDATKLVDEADTAISDARRNHPALEGATAAFGQASAQGVGVVTADQDPANVFLTDLGMVIPDEIKAASADGTRAFISEENTDLLNTDFLAMWNAGADPATAVKGWNELKAVKDGSSITLGTVEAFSLSQPSILSVPWLLDQLEPQFTALDDAS